MLKYIFFDAIPLSIYTYILIELTGPEICIYYNKCSVYKNDGYVRRYSENFKRKVLAEASKGNHSKRQIGLLYGYNPVLSINGLKNTTGKT